MTLPTSPALTPLRRVFGAADRALNRLYGWRHNPLYQSGTLVVVLWLVLLVTGLWLLLFYRIGEPWGSVARLTADLWTGNWVRGLHRYASDAAVVATLVHALRMLVQHRSWGPRTLAWVSGVVLLVLVLVCGWTGFVMVWDGFGLALAEEGARILEAVPLLSEPIRRAFTGERPVPDAFFFLRIIHDVDGIERIRFLTSHPNYFDDDLIQAIAELPRVMPHIELPIQAGDDEVLANMKRGYTQQDFRNLVAKIRERIPDCSIATDIIVGFPGETDEQFMETYRVLSDLRLVCCPFSPLIAERGYRRHTPHGRQCL